MSRVISPSGGAREIATTVAEAAQGGNTRSARYRRGRISWPVMSSPAVVGTSGRRAQGPDYPGPSSSFGQVPDQEPGGPVRQLVRCRAHRGGHQDPGQPAASAQGERDLRTVHRHPATGTSRPAASRTRTASGGRRSFEDQQQAEAADGAVASPAGAQQTESVALSRTSASPLTT